MSKHFHFIGIGGMGMGTIASLLIAKGYTVSGSDLKESEFTAKLKDKGAKIFLGHDAKNITHPDVVVYSSAIDKDNPELVYAKINNIPIMQRAQLLAKLMEKQKGITIAGAHGKTTTTSMISSLLINAGLHPTTAVGGIMNESSHGASLGDGTYFVAEVDESDGSFLYFSPDYSVITNMDFEHIDYYKSWDRIEDAYRQFIAKTHPEGCILAYGEDIRLRKLLSESQRRYITYGFSSDNDIVAINPLPKGYFSTYECRYKGKKLGNLSLKVPGKHNILNSLACVGIGMELAIDFSVIQKTLSEFEGAKRRFQLKGEVNEIMVVDDYGHHPTEIAATLDAAKSFGRKRIIAVFQPHRHTRTQFLMDEFVESLSHCDYLIITDIYAASEKPIAGVNAQVLSDKIKELNRTPVIYLKKEDILSHLFDIIKKGDLVLTLGAGDITRISDELVAKLNENREHIHQSVNKG